jgi:hypothetical protein
MPMPTLMTHYNNIMAMDQQTWFMILGICCAAGFAIKNHLPNPGVLILITPLTFAVALVAQYSLIMLEIMPTAKIEQWLLACIVSSGIGTIFSIVVMAIVLAFVDKPPPASQSLSKINAG